MGRALSDLKTNMSAAISGAPGAKKLLVQSCHDTSLAGMLATLGVFDHKWPGKKRAKVLTRDGLHN